MSDKPVCWQSQPAKDPHLLRLFRFFIFHTAKFNFNTFQHIPGHTNYFAALLSRLQVHKFPQAAPDTDSVSLLFHLSFCPVNALQIYLHTCSSPLVTPLFVSSDGSFLTRQQLSSFLTSILQETNLNTHSFRIGGAMALAAADYSDAMLLPLVDYPVTVLRDTFVSHLCCCTVILVLF